MAKLRVLANKVGSDGMLFQVIQSQRRIAAEIGVGYAGCAPGLPSESLTRSIERGVGIHAEILRRRAYPWLRRST
jgi:hypothetical protein